MNIPKPQKRDKAKRKPLKRSRIKPTKSTPKKLRAKCHELWSLIVRTRDGVCRARGRLFYSHAIAESGIGLPYPHLCTGQLQGAHGFPKGAYPSVRFDTWNGFALCAGAHTYYTHRGPEWEEFLRREWGELYAERYHAALTARKPDLVCTLHALSAELERVSGS